MQAKDYGFACRRVSPNSSNHPRLTANIFNMHAIENKHTGVPPIQLYISTYSVAHSQIKEINNKTRIYHGKISYLFSDPLLKHRTCCSYRHYESHSQIISILP